MKADIVMIAIERPGRDLSSLLHFKCISGAGFRAPAGHTSLSPSAAKGLEQCYARSEADRADIDQMIAGGMKRSPAFVAAGKPLRR
jgi:hypothetical protein